MFEFGKDEGPHPKCYFTHSLLPSYIDPQNPSTKKKPFSTFLSLPYAHTMDLILPEELHALVRDALEHAEGVGRLQYARVHMKLGELLQGEFFMEYIKKGNISMLSEGRPLSDNVFSLHGGTLRLELDKQTYQRCGLIGKAIEDGGKKHQKARWVVEFDLRAPHMFHGKKLFSRLEYACKNVLNHSLTWLFYNFEPKAPEDFTDGKDPLTAFAPFTYNVSPQIYPLRNILTPKLHAEMLSELYEEEDNTALLEWLHLVSLDSPRIKQGDSMDSFLSRYEVPDFSNNHTGIATQNLVRMRWKGFIPPAFVRGLFLIARQKTARNNNEKGMKSEKQDERSWFGLNVAAFGGWGGSYTIMQFPGQDTLTWECS